MFKFDFIPVTVLNILHKLKPGTENAQFIVLVIGGLLTLLIAINWLEVNLGAHHYFV